MENVFFKHCLPSFHLENSISYFELVVVRGVLEIVEGKVALDIVIIAIKPSTQESC